MGANLSRFLLPIFICCFVFATGCGDDDDAAADAAASVIDADPSAPDADTTPDADPSAPDATVTPDAPILPDAGEGVVGEVACGETTCTSPQVCCVDIGAGSAACGGAGSCGDDATVSCDGYEDCPTPGELCCTGDYQNPSTSCTVEASCTAVICRGVDECGGSDVCCDLGVGISVCLNNIACGLITG